MLNRNDVRTQQYIFRILLASIGGFLICIVVGLDLLREPPELSVYGPVKIALIVLGLGMLCAGRFLRIKRISALLTNVCITVVSFLSTLVLIEVFIYVLGYSPTREIIDVNEDSIPIYFRGPTLVEKNFYKRRSGPDIWQGKVLSAWLKYLGIEAEVYKDEVEVVIEYDEYGFRNPADLRDWDIVVIGDSFVELGYLPYQELFTTQLGRILGKKVKNLGVSYTGPLTHTHYLKEYGTCYFMFF